MKTLRHWLAAVRTRQQSRATLPSDNAPFRAKFDDAAFALLAGNLRERRVWPARSSFEADIAGTDTGALWRTIPGGHKWIDYFAVYDAELAHFRGKAPRVLEIGVYKGASLKLWKAYFGQDARIVGVDIDPDCAQFSNPSDDIHVRVGSQCDDAFLAKVVSEFGPFDVIIDDGSHVSSHQIAAFNALFDSGLKDGGSYLIEDLEAVYWGHATGQLDQPVSAMDFMKMLIDLQHAVFTTQLYPAFLLNSDQIAPSHSAPHIASLLHSVKFYRGMCFVTKQQAHPPMALHN